MIRPSDVDAVARAQQDRNERRPRAAAGKRTMPAAMTAAVMALRSTARRPRRRDEPPARRG